MKSGKNAKERREAEAARRKEAISGKKPATAGKGPVREDPPVSRGKPFHDPQPEKTPEEETREFLAYLEHMQIPAEGKPDGMDRRGRKDVGGGRIPEINLEDGMPLAEEAISTLRIELSAARSKGVPAVKLIHGYGSTGRGGKIKQAVHRELNAMKNRRAIRAYIPGENFGPFDPDSRELSDRLRMTAKDPDWGTCNHGITIAVLK